jgi:hypothetical protein
MSSFFTEKLAGQDVSDHHVFVTTHPYLIEMGLGTFTTGTLYSWWNQRNSNGLYLNRMCVNGTRDRATLENPPKNLNDLLGINPSTEFFWYGWKPAVGTQNAGVYKKQDLSQYGTGWGGSNPWSFRTAKGTKSANEIVSDSIDDFISPVIGGTLNNSTLDFEASRATCPPGPPGSAPNDVFALAGLTPIYDIINLNRYMNSFTDYYPRGLWDRNESTIGGISTDELYASHELLTEIKASKRGPFIQWSGEVTFWVNDANGAFNCPITEWVPFKVYLFDNATSQSANKAVTIKNLTYVAPKRDVTGRTFTDRIDGGFTEHDPADSASRGAGEIDVHYNTVTKKWESGTPQLFAKLVTSIGLPVVPSVDRLEGSNIEEDLNAEEYTESKFIPASGTAMPIRPQNGNPLQWQPNYLDSDDVRCSEDGRLDKETLTVYNFNTQRRYERNEEVLLSRIDGMWHVFPLWVGSGDGDVVTSDVGRWGEFTYMATNSEYFFRDVNGNRFSPRDAEQSFHKDYYTGDPLNDGVNYGVDGGYDVLQPFNTFGITPLVMGNGFFQTTSFDFLDSKLFGIRGRAGSFGSSADLCSISTTSATRNAAGNNLLPPNPEYAARNAAHAGLFFGCTFPAGYSSTQELLTDRDWNAVALSSGSVFDPTVYFNAAGSNNTDKPLAASDSTAARNNCRQPANAGPLEQLTSDNNIWSRRDGRASANLFAQYVEQNNQTFSMIPADVMTLASPQGNFGSPIYPVHRFRNFHQGTGPLHVESVKAFLSACWLGKEVVAGGTSRYTNEDSAFDLPPVSRNNLAFKPLKLEAYVQFGERVNRPDALAFVPNLDRDTGSHEDRRGFSVEAHRTQLDDKRPASYFVEDREYNYVDSNLYTVWGLKWGGELTYKPSYNNRHEFSYWDTSNGAMQWTFDHSGPTEWRGAGAFGVITTYNTVSAGNQIDFTTDNIYGMGAAAHGEFTINGGNRYQDRTWGVSNFIDSYRQENIHDLSIRIFHQHPREQTLFDPRTFAVHHFNPDVRYANDTYVNDDGSTSSLSPSRNIGSTDIGGRDATGATINFTYQFPLPSSVVDLPVVSRYAAHTDWTYGGTIHQDGQTYQSVELGLGVHIFANATYDGSIQPPVIPNSTLWQVDTNRVGKLLPYRHYRKVVGVPSSAGVEFDLRDASFTVQNTSLSNTPSLSIFDKLVVRDFGDSHQIGDTVGIASYGVRFEVTATGVNGSVARIKCLNPGADVLASQAAASGEVLNPDDETGLLMRTLDSLNGGSFEAYWVTARSNVQLFTDPKPTIMKRDGEEIVRIAADVRQGTHQTIGFTSAAEEGAFVNESRETTYILDPSLKSENNQYDIFFHFHNDVSMTWLASQERIHGNFNNITECSEQQISVRINPR